MAKAALAAMTRSLALELGPEIRVNGVAPGAVMWPSDGKPYDDQQAMLARTPLQRAGTPEDVAGAVLWLLRDAPFVTGQIIRVDGGRTLVGVSFAARGYFFFGANACCSSAWSKPTLASPASA